MEHIYINIKEGGGGGSIQDVNATRGRQRLRALYFGTGLPHRPVLADFAPQHAPHRQEVSAGGGAGAGGPGRGPRSSCAQGRQQPQVRRAPLTRANVSDLQTCTIIKVRNIQINEVDDRL